MIISAYFYDRLFSNTPLLQFALDLQQTAVTIEYDLDNFTTATFSLPLDADVFTNQKVEIFEEINWVATKIFIGYVFNIVPSLEAGNEIINVTAYSEKQFLSRRKVLGGANFQDETLENIMNSIVTQYNSNGDAWVINAGYTDLISIESNTGDSYYDFFTELATRLNAQWDVNDGVISIVPRIGTDLTLTDTEIVYAPNESNVSSINIVEENTAANVIVAKPSNGVAQIFPSPLPTVITWVEFRTFRAGNLQEAAEAALAEIQDSVKNYQISVQQESLDVNIGDLVPLRIEGISPRYDVSTAVTVLRKVQQYTNGVKAIQIEVWDVRVKSKNIINTINNLNSKVALLETS